MVEADRESREGSCHCGAVRFRVRLTEPLASARRCDCSFCRMRGAVVVSARLGDLDILQGADRLTLYTFNTGTARHHFCSVCGIYTHHQRRSNPSELGINVACLDGVSPFDFDCVEVFDGVAHPSDDPENRDRIAGVLRYERNVRRSTTAP